MSFDLHDLGIAYRKAKVDLYYSSHASLTAIADYEEALAQNLEDLLARLKGDDENWVQSADFLGGWTLVPKGIDLPKPESDDSTLIFASPAEEWAHVCESGDHGNSVNKPKAEFRLMAQCSLDFHVLSALWMLKVGHRYDRHLTDSAYGNRLRRGQNGDINPLSLGSFKPYLKPFRDWRDNGIQSMRSALAAGKRVVALTADVSSFYHELNPCFMLSAEFNALFDLNLTDEEIKLHRLFIQALATWAADTPLKKGLPVGLPASAIVANMALFELDRLIEEHVAPLYYGRYVDDIILVLENGKGFRSTASVWQWLFERSGGLLDWSDSELKYIKFKPAYLSDSRIQFSNGKNKVFLLSGEQGGRLVESIAFHIYQCASEWRALPNLPLDPGRVGTDLVAATRNDGEAADNLRSADALTMRRAGFAIKLRDFEAYERDLPPDGWQSHRHAFFRAFVQHVLVLPQYFELAQYVPRVLRLATACEDFDHLRRMLDELERLCDAVEGHCETRIKSCEEDQHPGHAAIIKYWRKQLLANAQESIIAAMSARLSKGGEAAWKQYMEDYWPKHSEFVQDCQFSLAGFQSRHKRLFAFDLAHMPFRFVALPKEMVAQRGLEPKNSATTFDEAHAVLPNTVCDGIRTLSNWAKLKGMSHGLLFATRPFSLTELCVLVKDPYAADVAKPLQGVVLAIRGFSPKGAMPHWDDKHKTLQIPHGEAQAQYGIVVSSWKTELQSWVASVMRKTDPDTDRYTRLNRLLTNVISQPNGASYLVLPELSLPAEWFMRLASRLKSRGISLITGVEYLHAPRKRVRNQVWAALLHDGLGFPSLMIYRQDKQRPAYHEERKIKRLADLELRPEKPWRTPPIVQHGDFRFAMLVCSELTNVHYRAALRGQVDALFVPEWNPDTTSFNSLVESAAMDIHAYIIQCNDREYGDSRIRAPYKDQWKRDMLRVKGGIYDYCVTGRIDVQSLRQFQSSHRSPDKPFKPVPDGFEMSFGRRVLPVGGGDE